MLRPVLLCLMLSVLLLGAAAPAPAAAAQGPSAGQVRDLLSEVLSSYARKDSPQDTRFYAGGRWSATDAADQTCWWCFLGPGTGSAALSRMPGLPGAQRVLWQRRAVATWNRAIRRYQQPDGGFGADRAADNDIITVFAGVELAHAYMLLEGRLDRGTRARWRRAVLAAARYLYRSPRGISPFGAMPGWYVNGNINLGATALIGIAARISGARDLRGAYQRAWDFTLHPPAARWSGRGLIARSADDGYLTETGPAGTGLDVEYASVQMDFAARLYLLTGDGRARRLLRQLTGPVLRAVRRSDWLLETSGGTRHPQPGRFVPMLSAGLAVQAWLAHRPLSGLDAQWSQVVREYRHAMTYTHPNLYRGTGGWLAVWAHATLRR